MALSTCLVSPPTMMLRVPLAAPSLPPLMGASSMRTPCFARCSPISTVARGLMVLMSITKDPDLTPPLMPRSPRTTASTSGVSLTQVMMTSQAAARAAGSSATSKPSATSSSSRSRVRFHKRGLSPAAARFRTIPRPMMPMPMKPMLSLKAASSGNGLTLSARVRTTLMISRFRRSLVCDRVSRWPRWRRSRRPLRGRSRG